MQAQVEFHDLQNDDGTLCTETLPLGDIRPLPTSPQPMPPLSRGTPLELFFEVSCSLPQKPLPKIISTHAYLGRLVGGNGPEKL